MGIDEIAGTQAFSAALALVAICIFISAIGACAGNIAVCQEHFCLFIIVLLAFFFDQNFFIVQYFKKLLSRFMVYLFTGAVIDVKRNSKIFKAFFDDTMVFIYNLLRRDSFFSRPKCDRNAMFVRAADVQNILPC